MSRWKQTDPNVQAATPEKLRIEIDNIFRSLMEDPDMTQYEFPNHLNNLQRKYIHEKAKKLNLQSKSHGKEPNRTLTIYKRRKLVNYESFYLNLTEPSSNAIDGGLENSYPLQGRSFTDAVRNPINTIGRIQYLLPVPVQPAKLNPLMEFRQKLPVYQMKSHILNLIKNNRVVIVSSETGSGKTTQIPQFLLEDAAENKAHCRIVCTQPRRISAVAVAERVAAERGEQTGSTVGYSIRLESKMGPNTSLYYCTNGVLLRTLMHDDKALFDITHVIVDEIHERDKFSDFLLIVLKAGLERNPNLKLILMSATLKTAMFESYFTSAVTCNIPGRTYDIKELFLEDILYLIKYESYAMSTIRINREKQPDDEISLDAINLDDHVVDVDMDDAINDCISLGNDEAFDHLIQLIVSEGSNTNYQHSVSGCTGLIAAAMHGYVEVIEKLIYLGAKIDIQCAQKRTAVDWAQYLHKHQAYEFLCEIGKQQQGFISQIQQQQHHHPAKNLLADYDKTVSDDFIDYDLIIKIIEHVHSQQNRGSILVFLPGYDDIMICQEMILKSKLKAIKNEFVIFLLHGSMQIGAQHGVFNVVHGKRKIILSTNVAETSITIDDVVYVIDTGRAKEKTFDAISGIGALQTTWISKACAKQRAGRAGRTKEGVCFHIYSRERFDSMQANRTPEILRVSLHELCLHTKMLAPPNMSIATFLSQALEPPSSIAVQSSVQSLQALGALDPDENLTYLGEHLLKISTEPHLAKILIYSTILRCVDPILTLVSCLAHKDPFVLPAQSKLKSIAQQKRKSLCFDALSDHVGLIRAFQIWQEDESKHGDKFCRDYFISSATMEMILQTRAQLLSQLRAAGFVQSQQPDNIQQLNMYSNSWAVIKAALVVGLYPNLAYVQNKKIITRTEKRVAVHTSSCLSKYLDDSKRNVFHNWVIFEELSKVGQYCNIKCATIISPVVVALMCGKATISDGDGISINIDDWLEFEPSNQNMYNFRLHLEEVIAKRIINPSWHLNAQESHMIDCLHTILAAEDACINLQSPKGIGQRPRFIQNIEVNKVQQNYYGRRTYVQMSPDMMNGMSAAPGPRFHRPGSSSSDASSVEMRYVNGHGMDARHMNGDNGYNRRRHHRNGYNMHNSMYFKLSQEDRLLSRIFLEHGQYYIIKPASVQDVDVSIRQRMWTFAPQCELKIVRTYEMGKQVILFFYVESVSSFVGVAMLDGSNYGSLGLPCPVKWLCRIDLPHYRTKHLVNSLNNFRRIFVCDDGQEVDYESALALYNLIFDSNVPEEVRGRPLLGNPI